MDRLDALSGLAQRIGSYLPSPYLAGIWGAGFIQELCWRLGSKVQIPGPGMFIQYPVHSPRVPGVPSWSCVSIGVGGIINSGFCFWARDPIEASKVRTAKLKGSATDPAAPKASYGAVDKAEITIEGFSRQITWDSGDILELKILKNCLWQPARSSWIRTRMKCSCSEPSTFSWLSHVFSHQKTNPFRAPFIIVGRA